MSGQTKLNADQACRSISKERPRTDRTFINRAKKTTNHPLVNIQQKMKFVEVLWFGVFVDLLIVNAKQGKIVFQFRYSTCWYNNICNDVVLRSVLIADVSVLCFWKTSREKASKQTAGKFQKEEQLKDFCV